MAAILLFDIDHTLIDTDRLFNEYLKPALREVVRLDQAEFDTLNDNFWLQTPNKALFTLAAYIEYWREKSQVAPEQLEAIFQQPEFYQQSLYPEVVSTLSDLDCDCQMGIYSQGDPIFQRLKLTKSGIWSRFTKDLVYITQDKTSEDYLRQLPRATVIEDREETIAKLQTCEHIFPIWLNRKSLVKHANVTTIHSLSEIISII